MNDNPCECLSNFTCRPCLDRADDRNVADALLDPWHPNHFSPSYAPAAKDAAR